MIIVADVKIYRCTRVMELENKMSENRSASLEHASLLHSSLIILLHFPVLIDAMSQAIMRESQVRSSGMEGPSKEVVNVTV